MEREAEICVAMTSQGLEKVKATKVTTIFNFSVLA